MKRLDSEKNMKKISENYYYLENVSWELNIHMTEPCFQVNEAVYNHRELPDSQIIEITHSPITVFDEENDEFIELSDVELNQAAYIGDQITFEGVKGHVTALAEQNNNTNKTIRMVIIFSDIFRDSFSFFLVLSKKGEKVGPTWGRIRQEKKYLLQVSLQRIVYLIAIIE